MKEWLSQGTSMELGRWGASERCMDGVERCRELGGKSECLNHRNPLLPKNS